MNPNLAALVGEDIAEQLVRTAGDLMQLSTMSPSALKHLGLSSARDDQGGALGGDRSRIFHAGILSEATVLADVSRDAKTKAVAKLANKAKLAAIADLSRSSPDGAYGRELRREIEHIIAQLEAPPPGHDEDPLPAPTGALQQPKRAGQKLQRIKAKTAQTLLERKSEVLKFAVDVDKQKEDLLRSRDVLAAAAAQKAEEALKMQRIVANGGKVPTGTKRHRDTEDYDDLDQLQLHGTT